jgi:hypothetical protein
LNREIKHAAVRARREKYNSLRRYNSRIACLTSKNILVGMIFGIELRKITDEGTAGSMFARGTSILIAALATKIRMTRRTTRHEKISNINNLRTAAADPDTNQKGGSNQKAYNKKNE